MAKENSALIAEGKEGNDYIFTGQFRTAWVSLHRLSIAITNAEGQAVVEIFREGHEMEEPLAKIRIENPWRED